MRQLVLMPSVAALGLGCQFGAQHTYSVDHGYADSKVMATDTEGAHILTSDVDAEVFRIYDVNGNEKATLPWASAGYGGGGESGLGPFNGAATAYGASGFYVGGGDGVIHWVFPWFDGNYATFVLDEVPVPPESAGRVKLCDISAGNDGSIYALTGEETGPELSLDWWARGAAWVHRRDPSGMWTHRQIAVHTYYISSLCGHIAFDVVTERLVMFDQVRSELRRMHPELSDDGDPVPVTDATSTPDFDALAGMVYRARCSGICGGETLLEILDDSGALSDARNTGSVHAIAVERPPLPIDQDQEAWLWTIGASQTGPLRKHELVAE